MNPSSSFINFKTYNLMKNTQKKLKAKHFRYLTQEHIDDPMKYLIGFFESETSIRDWLADLNTLINAASNAKMNPPRSSTGYLTRKLIEQVELAYVIFRKCKLKTIEQPLKFNKGVSDYWNQLLATDSSASNIDTAADSISRFFSYESLQQWYNILDDLWISLGDRDNGFLGDNGHEILAIKEFLLRLAAALGKIYEDAILPNTPESYQEKNVKSEISENLAEETPTSEKINTLTGEIKKSPQKTETLQKIKNILGGEDLQDWQAFINSLYISAERDFKSWDNAFKVYIPESRFWLFTQSITLLDILYEEVFWFVDRDAEIALTPRREVSLYYIFRDKNTIGNFTALSLLEASYPEYYLIKMLFTYPIFDWRDNLTDLMHRGFVLNKGTVYYGDLDIPEFLLNFQKLIELCYLLTNKDEIKFTKAIA